MERLDQKRSVGESLGHFSGQADAGVDDKWHAFFGQGHCHRADVAIGQLGIEYGRGNRHLLQKLKCLDHGSHRADDPTVRPFDRHRQIQRQIDVIFDNQDGLVVEQFACF
jgi:hypothetical protein